MNNKGQLTGIGILVIAAILLIAIIVTSPDAEPPTVSVYKDGITLEVATPSNYSLPDGAIIHKDLGKFWKCVEINGSYLLIRDSGPSSLAVKVDSCDPKANTIEGAHTLGLRLPLGTWGYLAKPWNGG